MATRGRTRLSREARRIINEIARSERIHSKTIEDAFLAIVSRYGDAIDQETVLLFIASGTLPASSREFREFVNATLRPLWQEMINVGSELADPSYALRGLAAQNLRERHVEAWMNSRGSELVTNFTNQQRRSINAIMEHQVRLGNSVDDMVDAMRGVVGLTERQSLALAKMREELRASGMSPKQVLIATERKRRQMEAQRARMIARTELSAATNEGIISTSIAVDEESDDGLTARMFVVAYPDCCSDCRDIEDSQPADGISLHDEWPEGWPPFHPNCMCTVDVRRMKI